MRTVEDSAINTGTMDLRNIDLRLIKVVGTLVKAKGARSHALGIVLCRGVRIRPQLITRGRVVEWNAVQEG